MGKRKKKRTHVVADEDEGKGIPKSFVFRRGQVGRDVSALVDDVRRMMEPYTAKNLKESQNNQLKDFLHVASPLGVTHFLVFNQTTVGTNMRLARVPRGPTLTFRVLGYSLMKDVMAIQKRPHSPGSEFMHSPLVVLNNFSGAQDEKRIMTAMLQNMFPAINIQKVKLAECRRVVLFNMNADNSIDMRHYVINASPVGLTKSVKRIIKAKIPDLSHLEDISDYVLGNEAFSDSEAEDTPETKVVLAQDFIGRGNKQSQKSAIRLKELGPRMKLQLIKIEEEFGTGRVIYHSLVRKTEQEAQELIKHKKESEALKESRRKQQEDNVSRKMERVEARKKRRLARAAANSEDGDEKTVEDDDAETKEEPEVEDEPEADTEDAPEQEAEDMSQFYQTDALPVDTQASGGLGRKAGESRAPAFSGSKRKSRK